MAGQGLNSNGFPQFALLVGVIMFKCRLVYIACLLAYQIAAVLLCQLLPNCCKLRLFNSNEFESSCQRQSLKCTGNFYSLLLFFFELAKELLKTALADQFVRISLAIGISNSFLNSVNFPTHFFEFFQKKMLLGTCIVAYDVIVGWCAAK